MQPRTVWAPTISIYEFIPTPADSVDHSDRQRQAL